MHTHLSRMRAKRADGDNGFTLIELLVVVVIIGVLIAIAIPLYLNYRKGAENKSAASDLRGAISTLEQCYGDSSSVYPATITINTAKTAYTPDATCLTSGASIKISSGTTMVYFPDSTNANYIIYATHNSGTSYCYASAAGGSIVSKAAVGTAYAAAC